MVHHTRDTAARVKKPVSNKTIIRLMISIGGVMFLFGLTWLFAVLTFSVIGLRETFQILFTIFNSFQGFFTFLFVCVSNKEAVESWKELVSCGRYRSNLLRPSTATSAAMRKSKQASNTGSIGQSLPPETSKSYYASVTLSKGNSYEKAPLETKADFETNSINKICEQESDQTSIKNITYIETFTQEVSSTAMNNPSDNENKSNDTVGEKEGEMKKKITSLKVRFRRYSTKRRFKHHAEEAEVDFYSDSTSSNEEDDGTQL